MFDVEQCQNSDGIFCTPAASVVCVKKAFDDTRQFYGNWAPFVA
jgi:hypothetical protein